MRLVIAVGLLLLLLELWAGFGCASIWWRDSSVNATRKCCWTGSQWGEATGCLVWADADGKCPERGVP